MSNSHLGMFIFDRDSLFVFRISIRAESEKNQILMLIEIFIFLILQQLTRLSNKIFEGITIVALEAGPPSPVETGCLVLRGDSKDAGLVGLSDQKTSWSERNPHHSCEGSSCKGILRKSRSSHSVSTHSLW